MSSLKLHGLLFQTLVVTENRIQMNFLKSFWHLLCTEIISWVVCDGDIDPEWIEALNSVLDDNRLLTMASGERIKFGPDVNFIFETHDLTYASPATISRMGVVYFR